jgi:hypothetical protein
MTDESFPPETHRYKCEKQEKIREIRSLAAVSTSFSMYTFEIFRTSLPGKPEEAYGLCEVINFHDTNEDTKTAAYY